MRRLDKLGDVEVAWEILRRAPVVHLAATDADGAPLLRALHPVLVDGAICFHGAPKGEKNEAIGRPVVIAAHEVVAELPSTFFDAERACPATTYFRSAMVHGVLELVDDLDARARVLQGLMERYQPGGGYRPITAADPLYAAAVRGIRILRVQPSQVVAKVSLGQMKSPGVRRGVVERLWERGDPGDAAAIEAVVGAAALDPLPDLLVGPYGTRLVVAPDARHVAGAVALLRDAYWNVGVDDATLAAAQRGSAAWVVVTEGDAVIATARALSDGAKTAYVADVAVAPAWRGRGVGRALMATLLAHPAVRGARRVDLMTKDAGGFYGRLGFERVVGREVWRLRRADARG